ncbi:MAG: 5-bromo-4-chloroindolyl phosphate hydrolysis family protein [Clostridiales bacterium]|nr:5-bromo-4-chloroindolyl phosphate hydrolysis family protein [Clostridiales bacterium]
MGNSDWQKKGNDFWNVVQDAVNTGNYQQLNQQVRDTIDDTVEGIRSGMQGMGNGTGFQDSMREAGNVFRDGMREAGNAFRDGMKGAGNGFRDGMKGAENGLREGMRGMGNGIHDGMKTVGSEWKQAWREAGQAERNRYEKSRQPAYQAGTRRKSEEDRQLPSIYAKNPPGQVSGTVMAVAGYSFMAIFGLAALTSGICLAIVPATLFTISTAVLGVIALGFLGMGIAGSSSRGFVKRFRNYKKQIGNRAYCTIEELSAQCGREKSAVIKDLKKMIGRRMFLQGHLDEQETCVIVTNEMYQQYLTVQQQARERQAQQEALEEKRTQLPEECRKILEEGNEYISFIRQCNDDIPGEEISMKLSRLELIITRIFEEVGKNPGLASDLRKFMSYYLPTTRKLINAYREMDREPIPSESIEKTKKEIEETLDTINQAFENLLNSFFKDRALDISSDISVLHTMLAQEGLTKGDFEK